MNAELARELELVTVLLDERNRPVIEWCPQDSAFSRVAGAVLIWRGKKVDSYALEESAGEDGNRAVRFSKLTGGTDKTESHYWLTCSPGGESVRCECRGFVAHGHCKHAQALGLLVSGGLV